MVLKTSGKDNRYGILQKKLKNTFGGNCNEVIIWTNGGTYREENCYLISNPILPNETQVEIGVSEQQY